MTTQEEPVCATSNIDPVSGRFALPAAFSMLSWVTFHWAVRLERTSELIE